MTIVLTLVGALVALWGVTALHGHLRRGLGFQQAILYAPLKLIFRVRDSAARDIRSAGPPVIYAIWHRSRLDPAFMLALLPEDTLHILDERSATAWWLDPWRALARTIAFNARHVFLSRRLVRRLKGNGRLAVYMPDDETPDARTFRLFRAVARIATKADARIVPIQIDGRRHAFWRGPRLEALEPMTVAEMVAMAEGEKKPRASQAMFARMMELRGTHRAD